jgi:Fe-S oxidoreductase
MYYDAFFPEFKLSTLNGTRAVVQILNKLGVKPVVSAAERCCGHDLLWNGDHASFEALAKHNVDLVSKSGAKTLVTNCAECLRTWKLDYEPYFDGKAPKVLHITEYLTDRLGELSFKKNGGRKVTYQDPCRLGRHLGIYDAPRQVLSALPGVELSEMRRAGRGAICCAGGTWSNCDRFAKKVQVDRLREARATKADLLLTACPKCQIHFKCAMKDPALAGDIEIEMHDILELVADSLD